MRKKLIEEIVRSCEGMNVDSLEQVAEVAAAIASRDCYAAKSPEPNKRPELRLIVGGGVSGSRFVDRLAVQSAG